MTTRTNFRAVGIAIAAVFAISPAAGAAALYDRELELPARGLGNRVTQRTEVAPNETLVLFDEDGPGCILHWWLTCSHGRSAETDRERIHDLQLKLYYDGQDAPAIDMTLGQFFGILMNRDTYTIDNAAFKVLPKNAFNSYWPIPFRKLRIELENTGPGPLSVWFMADWQKYPEETALTPLRLRAVHRVDSPAAPFGSFLMADFSGEGFLAGMVHAVGVIDRTDSWYHSGGDVVLLDGETAPRAIRGVGGEDVFNMSFGIWPIQTEWVGAPLTEKRDRDNALGSGYDGVMYRIFGPDPIWFDSSAVLRFGSKANHLESVVYAYTAPVAAVPVLTVRQWQLAGPFPCVDEAEFARREWAEDPVDQWPETHVADFGPYLSNLNQTEPGPTSFSIPAVAESEHAWCDFAAHFRGRRRTNVGAQPAEVAAYAVGTVSIQKAGEYLLSIGYDDWLTLWVDGRQVHTGCHDHGLAVDRVPVALPAGDVEIRIKLSNFDNMQWRLWAFSLTLAGQ